MHVIKQMLFILGFVISLTLPAFAQDVTLSWDPSPTPEVTGYNVYYKTGDMDFPFDGTGADQGASPVDVGNVLSTTLTGLADGVPYYFTVTAYDDSANQSTYSNIVSNTWIPALLTPADQATNEPVPVTFQWETAPTEYSVTYTLYYGTDADEVGTAGNTIPLVSLPTNQPPSSPGHTPLLALALSLILGLYLLRPFRNRAFRPGYIALAVLLGGLLTACGGGGGGGDGTTDRAATTEPDAADSAAADSVLYAVDKGTSDYHQAFDLEAGTTYYWKIVATDTNDSNLVYESPVQSFTTESF